MRSLLVVLLVVAGCHKASESTSPKDADALWALAPAGMKLGVVVTPRGVRMLENAWRDVQTFVKNAPDLAPAAAELDKQLASIGGAASLADLGLTADKGAAFFFVDEQHSFLVVPLADRDKFLAKVHGAKGKTSDKIESDLVCKPFKGVYACGDTEQTIEALGSAKALPKLDARGDIEFVGDAVESTWFKHVSTVLQLERGGFVMRGTVSGVPAPIVSLVGHGSKIAIDRDHTAGFLSTSVAGVKSMAPPIEIGAGVTLASLASSLVGPVTITIPAGVIAFDAQLPVTDPAPAQTLIDHCGELVPGAAVKDGTCTLGVPMLNISISAWIENKTLRIGTKGAPKPNTVALTPVAAELAGGTWDTALWGRGSMLAAPFTGVPSSLLDTPQARAGLKAATMFSEMGLGVRLNGDELGYVGVVRTVWANPDDIVAKVTALPMTDILASGAERARAIAGTSSPLAGDLQAGYLGLLIPTGIVAGVAIPAAIDRMKPPRQQTVLLDLNKLGKALKIVYAETGAFPKGDAPLTPAGGCCGPQHDCAGTPADWAKEPWKSLDFTPTETALYMYGYHSDGKTAEVDAVGDLDCDGIAITYKLKATVGADGNPAMAIEAPPPNTD